MQYMLRSCACTHIIGGADLNTMFDHNHADNMHIGTVTCSRSNPSRFSEAVSRDTVEADLWLASSLEIFCRPSYIGSPLMHISIDAHSVRAIDYIVTSHSIHVAYASTDRSLLVKYPTRFTDHYPLVGSLSIPASDPKHAPYSRRVQEFDVSKIGDPECDSAFQNCLHNLSGVPFRADSTCHNYVLDQEVNHAPCSSYPKLKKSKRKKERKTNMEKHISDSTFKLILERNKVLSLREKFFVRLAKTALLVVFKLWASSRCQTRWSLIFGLNKRNNLIKYERYCNQL